MSRKQAPPSELAAEVGRRFSTAVVLYHSAIAEGFGLNATDWKCNEILSRLGPMNPSQLAEHTGMSTAAVTLVLDRLEQAGFARRERDQNDRRKVIVSSVITPQIEAKVGDVFMGLNQKMAALMSRYSSEQLAAIGDYIQQSTLIIESETLRLRKRSGRY